MVATPGAFATSHSVTGLEAETPYHYRITARATADGDHRDSEPSAVLTVTTKELGKPLAARHAECIDRPRPRRSTPRKRKPPASPSSALS